MISLQLEILDSCQVNLSKCSVFLVGVVYTMVCLSAEAQLVFNADKVQFNAQDSSCYLKFSARIQPLFRLMISPEEVSEEALIRRMRFKSDGLWKSKLGYNLQVGFAPSDFRRIHIPNQKDPIGLLYDAQIHWRPNKYWKVSVGQGKLPGGRERLMSSQNMQFVDRSLVDQSFTLNRGIGLQMRHEAYWGRTLLRQFGSIALGEGGNVLHMNPQSGLQYTCRTEMLPFGGFDQYSTSDLKRNDSPKFALGLVFDLNIDALRAAGVEGDFVVADSTQEVGTLRTVIFDAIYKFQGWSSTVELVRRDTPQNPENGFLYGQAFKGTLGYLFRSNFELAGRISMRSPIQNSSVNRTKDYTLGLSRYLKGHQVKIQSDLTRRVHESDTSWLGRIQLELSI